MNSRDNSRIVDNEKANHIAHLIWIEMRRAVAHHGGMIDGHHAYGVIGEEFAEFFDEVRANDRGKQALELIQTAAMCHRALHDVYPDLLGWIDRMFTERAQQDAVENETAIDRAGLGS